MDCSRVNVTFFECILSVRTVGVVSSGLCVGKASVLALDPEMS
jgi:hypothetical protein